MKKSTRYLTFSAMLSALGIIIPLIMPKIVIGDAASYTLASHVPLFIAMFMGPDVALLVGLATSLGFFISLPPIVAARAFSHLFWAIPMALILKRHHQKLMQSKMHIPVNLLIGFFHALFECIAVGIFYASNLNDLSFLLKTILLPIGIGGFIHSLIDFQLSIFVYRRLPDQLKLTR